MRLTQACTKDTTTRVRCLGIYGYEITMEPTARSTSATLDETMRRTKNKYTHSCFKNSSTHTLTFKLLKCGLSFDRPGPAEANNAPTPKTTFSYSCRLKIQPNAVSLDTVGDVLGDCALWRGVNNIRPSDAGVGVQRYRHVSTPVPKASARDGSWIMKKSTVWYWPER